MKYLVSELAGDLLDAAVVLAVTNKRPLSIPPLVRDTWGTLEESRFEAFDYETVFEPSSRWAHGGPVIEREGLEFWKWVGSDGTYWVANVGGRKEVADGSGFAPPHAIGATPLIAAMRAFVFARRGAEVDL